MTGSLWDHNDGSDMQAKGQCADRHILQVERSWEGVRTETDYGWNRKLEFGHRACGALRVGTALQGTGFGMAASCD